MQPYILQRVNSAIDYIEQHLGEPLDLDTLAAVACLSKFHFHRVFKLINGETPHEFITRKRLEKIASLLINGSSERLSSLSTKYGFENPASFSRAFKKFYGHSASTIQSETRTSSKQASFSKSKIGKARINSHEYLSTLEQTRKWMDSHGKIEILEQPERKIVYIRNRGNVQLVTATLSQLASWAEKQAISLQGKSPMIVFHDIPSITCEYKMQQSACFEYTCDMKLTDEVNVLTIPATRYLVGNFQLDRDEFETAWDSMVLWMDSHKVRSKDGYRFELLPGAGFHQTSNFSMVEISIPVR